MKLNKLNIVTILALLGFLGLTSNSCTNLDEEIYSELDGEIFFDNPDNLIFAFGTAYTNLYWTFGHKYGFGRDCGTDIAVVPQRHGDWFDGGEWIRYHRLEWTPQDAYIEFWWNLMYKGINRCNSLIYQFESVETDEAAAAIAELRAFRALYYYWLMDYYGNVPLVTEFDVPVDFAPTNNTRLDIYTFIETELTESLPLLTKETGSNVYGRVNYFVAQMALAKLYINAEVFTGTAQWAKANDALDEIINSDLFELSSDYFDNFRSEASIVDNSKEILMGVPMDEVNAQGMEIHLFSLHYNLQDKFEMGQLPWNGICVQESFFNLFDENDLRLNGLVYGEQYNSEGIQIQDPDYERFDPTCPTCPRDLDGPGLNLTPEVNMLEPDCIRQAGARVNKWQLYANSDRYLNNDFPIFRYSDVLLMKAEVLLRNGGGDPATYFNMVHERAGLDPLATVTLDDIIDERARELYMEGYRRNDLIRFGKYLDERWEKEGMTSDHVLLWPIPQDQIDANGNLVQNPGY